MITTIGWIVWGIVAVIAVFYLLQYVLFCTAARAHGSRDGGGHQFFGLPALILSIGLLLTALGPISKFHLLWFAPFGTFVPFFIVQWRLHQSSGPLAQMIKRHLEEESGGEVWDLPEMRRLFKVYDAESPREFAETVSGPSFEFWWIAKEPGVGLVKVIRRADKIKGTLFFKDNPRFYFGWRPDDAT
jgi:hypothetical protein